MTTDDVRPSDHAIRELAAAASSLVAEHDVIGTLTTALAGCARSVNSDAAGIIVTDPDRYSLELLAATNHQQLELYEVQRYYGPAADTIRTGTSQTIQADRFAQRWPADVAAVLRANRVTGIHASPLKWHNIALGAMNLFFIGHAIPDDVQPISQAFCDLATLAIVHNHNVSTLQVIAQLRAALDGRTAIELAKGVIAYAENISPSDAFDHLRQLALERRLPLSVVSQNVIRAAMNT